MSYIQRQHAGHIYIYIYIYLHLNMYPFQAIQCGDGKQVKQKAGCAMKKWSPAQYYMYTYIFNILYIYIYI